MVAVHARAAHHARLSEDELIRAHSAGAGTDPEHTPTPHELRNAWQTAKQLEDRLELADQQVLRRVARWLREETFVALLELEGYVEVPADDAR